MNSGPGLGSHNMTQEERERAATIIWHEEKGLAIAVIVLSWVAKVRPAFSLPHRPG